MTGVAELAERIDRLGGVRCAGVACYPGHLREPAGLEKGMAELEALLGEAVREFDARGLDRSRISAGSSPTAFVTHLAPSINESRAGSCALGDLSDPGPRGYALTILSTVVSCEVPGQVVMDAGSKTLSSDRALDPSHPGFGRVVGHPEWQITGLFEEHAVLDTCGESVEVGDVLQIIPTHCCAVMNLHDEVVVTAEGAAVDTWPIEARGMSR